MSFTAILFALLLEQARPLARGNPVHAAIRAWVRWSSRSFDAGGTHHAWVAWGFAVALPTLIAFAVHWLLMIGVGWPVAVLWNMAILYAALGFRQFSHHFTGIRDALDSGDEALARERLARWRQMDTSKLQHSDVVRQVIEHSVLAAHRHVFGVLGWFSVLSAFGFGPAGAVLYRMSEFVTRYWQHRSKAHYLPVSAALQGVAIRFWHFIDWLPARVTAFGFAVVGSFEDAIDAWRNYAQGVDVTNEGVIIAATAGAINVRLGEAVTKSSDDASDLDRPGSPSASSAPPPELAHLRSIVGLVWRSVVMWMVLLALLTLARLLG